MGPDRQRHQRFLLPDAPLVRVVGKVISADSEHHENREEIDHVWIRIFTAGELILSVNTSSRRNRLGGFDPRIRVGLSRGKWPFLPPVGAEVCPANDYEEIESRTNVFFEHYERPDLEDFLLALCRRACLLEAWGAPYHHRAEGLHQIHSRRASCAVPEDIIGRDGALKFYFESGQETALLLFKFCGQP